MLVVPKAKLALESEIMDFLLTLLLGLGILVAFYTGLTFNGLVRKRQMVKNTFSSVDVALQRRAELIPNLVEVVKGYAKHEQQLFDSVTRLRSKVVGQPATASRMAAEEQLTPQLGRLMAVAEDYPELKADSQFLNLQRNLTEAESQIAASRRAYNASVFEMNTAVQQIPSSIVASVFGFDETTYFEADKDKLANPDVVDKLGDS